MVNVADEVPALPSVTVTSVILSSGGAAWAVTPEPSVTATIVLVARAMRSRTERARIPRSPVVRAPEAGRLLALHRPEARGTVCVPQGGIHYPFLGRRAAQTGSGYSVRSASIARRCSIARCDSWICAVVVDGTLIATTARVASAPPDAPVIAITAMPAARAVSAAATMLGELPLVEIASRTSPATPVASIC